MVQQSFCVGDYSDDAVLCAEHCNTESQRFFAKRHVMPWCRLFFIQRAQYQFDSIRGTAFRGEQLGSPVQVMILFHAMHHLALCRS